MRASGLLLVGILGALVAAFPAYGGGRRGGDWSSSPVRLTVSGSHVVLNNGIVEVYLTKPAGDVAAVRYHGENLLETENREGRRGYWDVSWNAPGSQRASGRSGSPSPAAGEDGFHLSGQTFEVVVESKDQVEVSFKRAWKHGQVGVPSFNVDKRYIMLRNSSGFYTYAIYERPKGWPDLNIYETRVVFRLDRRRFHYMAIADNRQRFMPMAEDREKGRGQVLGYKEAVRLTNPINPSFRGEVDDKYQYSMDNKDNKVHGWICTDTAVGFWIITPSNEFKTGGPLKQDLTSHTGPIALSMFMSVHYAGDDHTMMLRNGEHWKKVFGPVFVYVNSNSGKADIPRLWDDAKSQMKREVNSWPYNFPASRDYPKAAQRGSVSGRLLVRERFSKTTEIPAASAHIGLAPPGEPGSWQTETKGYQFWVTTYKNGAFLINNVRPGVYDLYAWVPGFIGDYKHNVKINVTAGSHAHMGDLVYEPPRDGPTLWEIGIPDRTAAEFFVPDPRPDDVNKLYVNHPQKFRQYGLWYRYADLYRHGDLVYTVGVSDYTKDWFFAHVNRWTGNSSHPYQTTTWKIKFKVDDVVPNAVYKLRLAIASASDPFLHVCFNKQTAEPQYSTGHIRAENNAIARHGIHGLHWLFTADVQSGWLVKGDNVLFLTQNNGGTPFTGLMYDYIRLEGPPQRRRTPH